MRARDNLKKGSVELILLSLLMQGDLYGYQMVQLILEQGDGSFNIPEGSMYPTLYRLEDQGYISSEKKLVGKRMTRVYYHLEPSGKEYFQILKEDYYNITENIMKILKHNENEVDDIEHNG